MIVLFSTGANSMSLKMREFTIQIPGFSIAAKSVGDPSNPPMLALHGWLDNANSFDCIASSFSKHFHFIAVDLPGHGCSSHIAAGCHYHFIDGIGIVREILDALGHGSAHLLGHSMGACLASLVAGVLPKRCDSLFLIEGLGPLSAPSECCAQQLQAFYHYDRSNVNIPNRAYDSLQQASKARAKRGHVSLEIASILTQRGVKFIDGKYYWQHDKRLIQPSPLRLDETMTINCLQNINARTALIIASDGFDFGSSLFEKRVSSVKKIQTFKEQGGHHLHMENPQRMYAIAKQFYQL